MSVRLVFPTDLSASVLSSCRCMSAQTQMMLDLSFALLGLLLKLFIPSGSADRIS